MYEEEYEEEYLENFSYHLRLLCPIFQTMFIDFLLLYWFDCNTIVLTNLSLTNNLKKEISWFLAVYVNLRL